MDTFAIRLRPGDDLRSELERLTAEQRWDAALVLGCVGSLTGARLRLAGSDQATQIAGDLEIIMLSGTLGPDGSHLHLAVADRSGTVTGGHVLPGCRVRTTAEVVIGRVAHTRFARQADSETGYRELVIQSLPGNEEPHR